MFQFGGEAGLEAAELGDGERGDVHWWVSNHRVSILYDLGKGGRD